MKIGEKLKMIYGNEVVPVASLELLAKSSSSIAHALKIVFCVPPGKEQNMVAQTFLNVYASGFIAGYDFEKGQR
jgi:hypothetical protein